MLRSNFVEGYLQDSLKKLFCLPVFRQDLEQLEQLVNPQNEKDSEVREEHFLKGGLDGWHDYRVINDVG